MPSFVRSASWIIATAAVLLVGVLYLAWHKSAQESDSMAADASGPATGMLVRNVTLPFLNMKSSDVGRRPPRRWIPVNAFPHLTFQDPLMILPIPRSNALCVIGRQGIVYTFKNDREASKKTVLLDIHDHCQGWGDSGLLGIAFHPQFGQKESPNRGYFYIWYNYSENAPIVGRTPDHRLPTRDRLVRYTIPDGAETADPASALILIDQSDRDLWHNGGGMFFGNDGFLYLSLGDEGREKDFFRNAQRIDGGLFSGLIRIDVDQDPQKSHPIRKQPANGSTGNYFIPNDNPWGGNPEALEEFYCIGLRNPHRATFDEVTGSILCGDCGQGGWEEIDLLQKGGNYQWAFREGNHPGPQAKPDVSNIIGVEHPPLYEYGHSQQGAAVVGGYVYRGKKMPEFFGQYIFGDNVSGRIFAMADWETNSPILNEITRMPGRAYSGLSSFGRDADGEIYMCQLGAENGSIFCLTHDESSDGPLLPDLLSKTHVFESLTSMNPAPELIPYSINVPFWSDGASKRRWISLPGQPPFVKESERIQYSDQSSFTFPTGTVFVKHFDLPLDKYNPTQQRRIETRLLVRGTSGGVYGATYRWRADNSDADRVDQSTTDEFTVASKEDFGQLEDTNIGSVVPVGQFHQDQGHIVLAGSGAPIKGSEDSLSFASVSIEGDFDVRVKVSELTVSAGQVGAGLMFRQSTAADSPMFCVLIGPGSTVDAKVNVSVIARIAVGQLTEQLFAATESHSYKWLRFRRQGSDTFIAYSSEDGLAWKILGNAYQIHIPTDGRIGVALTSGELSAAASTVFDDLGPLRNQTWYYPSPSDCLTCHNPTAGYVLGVNARQLNMDINASNGASANQLALWAQNSMLTRGVSKKRIESAPHLFQSSDAAATIEDRARSYLDANCAYCHQPVLGVGYFDARFSTPVSDQHFLTSQLRNDHGIADPRVVSPGDLDRSILWRRMRATTPAEKMPPVSRNRIDEDGTTLIRDWILEMGGQPLAPSN